MTTVPHPPGGSTPSRKSGSLWWFSEILDDLTLDPTDTLVMLALADHVDANDACFPGIHEIAWRARCSYTTAKRRLSALEEEGRITRARRRSRGNLSTYTYTLVRQAESLGTNLSPSEISRDHQGGPLLGTALGEPAEVTSIEQTSLIRAPDPFDEFWEAFPKKAGKASARKAWAKAIKSHPPAAIIAGARAYAADPNRNPSFTKYPQGWLNDERWDDLPAEKPATVEKDRVFLPGSGWVSRR